MSNSNNNNSSSDLIQKNPNPVLIDEDCYNCQLFVNFDEEKNNEVKFFHFFLKYRFKIS